MIIMDNFNYIVNKFFNSKYKFKTIKDSDEFALYYINTNKYLEENNIIKLDYKTIVKKINESKHKEIYLKMIKDYKQELMFKSDIHGISHIIRTSIFLLILSVFEEISEEEFILALESILYHDVGRVNDIDDEKHGFNAINKIGFLKDKYSVEDYNYICAAITGHSIDDEKYEYVVDYFHIKDINKYLNLLNLVKDADALDRVREYPFIDIKYLRTSSAKRLVSFAYELYYNYISNTLS